MTAYTMTNTGLAVFSSGVALPVPAADVPSVAVLFLADGETLEIRPANAFRYARLIAYGVAAGRYRRLPIVVGSR